MMLEKDGNGDFSLSLEQKEGWGGSGAILNWKSAVMHHDVEILNRHSSRLTSLQTCVITENLLLSLWEDDPSLFLQTANASFFPLLFPSLLIATPCFFFAACAEQPRCSRRSRRSSHRLDGNPSGCAGLEGEPFFFLLVPLDYVFSLECSRQTIPELHFAFHGISEFSSHPSA